jgi:hypothetical protein
MLTRSTKFTLLNNHFKTLFYSLTCSNRSLLNKRLPFNSKTSKTKPKIYHSMNNYEKPKENSKQHKDSPPPKMIPKTFTYNPITTSTLTTQNYSNPDPSTPPVSSPPAKLSISASKASSPQPQLYKAQTNDRCDSSHEASKNSCKNVSPENKRGKRSWQSMQMCKAATCQMWRGKLNINIAEGGKGNNKKI